MVRILEIDRNLSGFNITIFLYFTNRCVDKFITESEIQMALTAPANQTTRDSSKWQPANHTHWDERVLHSTERHIMAERYQVEDGTFSNRNSNFSGRSYIFLLKLFYKNYRKSDGGRRIEYNFLVKQIKWIIFSAVFSKVKGKTE